MFKIEPSSEGCLYHKVVFLSSTIFFLCVSQGKASPTTAKVKFRHGGKEITDEPEAAREVARGGSGGGRRD